MPRTDVVTVSAPGKIILHGEHAVVYGKVAIAANLNLRCHLTVKSSDHGVVILDLPDISTFHEWKVSALTDAFENIVLSGTLSGPSPANEATICAIKKFLGIDDGEVNTKELAVVAFLYLYASIYSISGNLPAISVHMKSDIPVGAGLGSSAAFSVSLSSALLQQAGIINHEKTTEKMAHWSSSDCDIINKWAFIGEKVIHGRPSGIDNSISTYGGALRFQKGAITHLEKMPTLSMMLVNSKVPRSTLTLVANFRSKYNKYKEIFDPVLDAVEAITEKSQQVYDHLCDSPSKEDYVTLGDIIDLNHQFLNMMGVGHKSLEQIVSIARENNLHAKLTGAGGGGCAFILIPPDTEESVLDTVSSEMEKHGYQVWKRITVGGHGVRRHLDS